MIADPTFILTTQPVQQKQLNTTGLGFPEGPFKEVLDQNLGIVVDTNPFNASRRFDPFKKESILKRLNDAFIDTAQDVKVISTNAYDNIQNFASGAVDRVDRVIDVAESGAKGFGTGLGIGTIAIAGVALLLLKD